MTAARRKGSTYAGSGRVVLSASRRTDIPAFYMPWFMKGITRGEFEVVNPFNRRLIRVVASAPPVHTIVFWSKNYDEFIRGDYGVQLQRRGYHLFFQFTINSADPLLEPNVPSLEQRLRQLKALCRQFGPAAVNWRFDPICHFQWDGAEIRDNLIDFPRIADAAARAGVRRCTVSFMDHYPKIARRLSRINGLAFVDVDPEAKRRMLIQLEQDLTTRGIRLFTCCESRLLDGLAGGSSIQAGACIPSELLMELYGGRLSTRRDPGQRRKAGCECRVSVDIGSYSIHPCRHNCLFCYANPCAGPGRPSGRPESREESLEELTGG